MAELGPAFDFAMKLEGGGKLHTVEGDPGGTTKWGISQRANPDVDIAALTREDAMEIYDRRYWAPRRLGELRKQPMADEIFEFTINSDPAYENRGVAIRTAQEAANDVLEASGLDDRLVEDGVIGFNTISVLNAIGEMSPIHLFAWRDRFNLLQLKHYKGLRWGLVKRFFIGWSRRVLDWLE